MSDPMTPDPAQVDVAELRLAAHNQSAGRSVDSYIPPTHILVLLDRLEAAEAKVAACCGARERVEALIEASSLGSPEAKAARESVPREVGIAIAAAARHMRRANDAEAKVAAVQALANDLLDYLPQHGDFLTAGRRLRAALESTP